MCGHKSGQLRGTDRIVFVSIFWGRMALLKENLLIFVAVVGMKTKSNLFVG